MPSTSSLKLIERKIKELQTLAEKLRRNEQEGVEQLRAVIEKYKLEPAHLKMAMGGMGAQRSAHTRPHFKTAPKYRSLDNAAAVWSGRGRKPSWLVAGLKSGRTIDEFLIRDTEDETSDPSPAAK
jgi:DNA-binding protein H-NS